MEATLRELKIVSAATDPGSASLLYFSSPNPSLSLFQTPSPNTLDMSGKGVYSALPHTILNEMGAASGSPGNLSAVTVPNPASASYSQFPNPSLSHFQTHRSNALYVSNHGIYNAPPQTVPDEMQATLRIPEPAEPAQLEEGLNVKLLGDPEYNISSPALQAHNALPQTPCNEMEAALETAGSFDIDQIMQGMIERASDTRSRYSGFPHLIRAEVDAVFGVPGSAEYIKFLGELNKNQLRKNNAYRMSRPALQARPEKALVDDNDCVYLGTYQRVPEKRDDRQ